MRLLPQLCKRGLFFSLLVLAALAPACATNPATEKSAGGGVITNDVFYKDADGNPIYSQGGGIFKFGDTYYWYGVKYNGAVTYYNNPAAGKVAGSSFNAITCYSSKDLVHWKFENNVLSAASPGMPRGWVGRMGVAYNPNTKKYVLMSQGGGGELFATCDTPTGDFTFDHVQRVIPNMVTPNTGDQTVFVDTDGKAYLICCNANGRDHLYVCPLREADFLEVEPAVLVFTCAPGKEGAREGNCMFKYDGHYISAPRTFTAGTPRRATSSRRRTSSARIRRNISCPAPRPISAMSRRRVSLSPSRARRRRLCSSAATAGRIRRQRAGVQRVVPAVVRRDDAAVQFGFAIQFQRHHGRVERRAGQ